MEALSQSLLAMRDSSVDHHISRICNVVITYTSNPNLTADQSGSDPAEFTATVTELLMINPLIFGPNWWRRPTISQITNLTVNMTFDPIGMNRIWGDNYSMIWLLIIMLLLLFVNSC